MIKRIIIILFFIYNILLVFSQSIINDNGYKYIYLWTMDTSIDLDTIAINNSNVKINLNANYKIQGTNSLEIIPDGKSKETKLFLKLDKDRLKNWLIANEIAINLYVSSKNTTIPNEFFLGLFDNSNKYIGGINSNNKIKSGWNKIYFLLNNNMKALKQDISYTLLFEFSNNDKDYVKIPLIDNFYIDGVYISGNMAYTKDELISKIPDNIKTEVNSLINMKDEELLDKIEKKTFDYFWNEANSKNGLVKDRYTNNSLASIAATGWALTVIPIGIQRGWINKDEGYNRILTTLNTFKNGLVEGKNGFFYHFIDINTGKRSDGSEISSIDTSIFIAGAILAGEFFKGTEVEKIANELYKNINWKWMANGQDTLSMGYKPESGFISSRWNNFSEGILGVLLALGSPTYPLDKNSWDKIFRNVNTISNPKKTSYISVPDEVLCMYQYPQNWVDLRNKEDIYANYYNNTIIGIIVNQQYAINNSKKIKSYDSGIWGISPSDGPPRNGVPFYYEAYGAVDGRNDGTITPNVSIASIGFTPDLSIKTIKAMLKKYGPLIWNKYGFTSAFNEEWNWYSTDYLGIDQGNIIVMIENYRTGLIWKYFMQNECIKTALINAGFKSKKSSYTVTPEYLKKLKIN